VVIAVFSGLELDIEVNDAGVVFSVRYLYVSVNVIVVMRNELIWKGENGDMGAKGGIYAL
jgi:hypothetical protein